MTQLELMCRRHRMFLGTILVLGLLGLPAQGSRIPLHLSINEQKGPDPSRAVEVQVVGGPSGREQKEILQPAALPGLVTLDLPDPGVWYVRGRAPGFWSETRVIVTPYSGQSLELRFWPTATLRAEVPSTPRLRGVSVRFQQVVDVAAGPKQDMLPSATNDCRLDGRAVECVVPAGLIDFSLRSAGYVPIYRWNQKYSAGQIVNLGKVEFRRGSSLRGNIAIPSGKPLPKGSEVRVTLEPNTARALRPEKETRSKIAATTVFANSRGIFVFEGVTPGGYQLSANAPGLISGKREVTVLDGLEAELRDPLVLMSPLKLDVNVDPPTDPWRKPWSMELMRIDVEKGHGVVVSNSNVGRDGQWTASDLPPGHYLLSLSRQPQGVWHSQLVVLDEDTRLDVKIPLVRVAGTLSLGGSPLSGSIWFGGERGEISVPLTTDAQGAFKAILPAVDKGVWKQVDVVAENPTVRRTLNDVRIPEPDDDGISTVAIDLPSNRLYGEVTTESDSTISSATVFLSIPGEERGLLQTHVDDAGQFSFSGLAPATYSLRAIAKSGKSSAVNVVIEESSQEFAKLVVRQSGELQGVVTSRYGPVSGTRVSTYPDDRTAFDLVEWAMTDHEGRFSVPVAPEAQYVSVTVAAPGFAYQFFRAAIDRGSTLPVRVDQDGGRLVITLNGPKLPFVFHGGGFLALEDLLGDRVAVMTGQTVTADNLQAGQYELCLATPIEALGFAQSTRPKDRCSGGFLPPGGQLNLSLPSHNEAVQ